MSNTFAFTFGTNHPLGNQYIKIVAPDFGTARTEMFRHFDKHWAFQYTWEDFQESIEKYNYTQAGRTLYV